jgi:hypothetical protein
MIKDNEKRRIVASKLRRLCGDGTPDNLLWHKVEKIIHFENEYSCKDVVTLANLIDRDTCTNESMRRGVYECSACFYRDSIDGRDWSYCPHCGAEIIWFSEQ